MTWSPLLAPDPPLMPLPLASGDIVTTRRYWTVPAAVMAAMLLTFAVVEALGVELLRDPQQSLDAGGALAAATGIALLVADVFFPVPSSGVMLAHGALFGVVIGAALSLAGSVGAFSLGFALGRRGEGAMKRLVAEEERNRADRLLGRWGVLAIVVTRPVPILAETMAFMAGASPLGWRTSVVAALVGSLPAAVLYAVAGAAAASFATGAVVFAAVILLGLGVALVSRRTAHESAPAARR